MTFSARVWGDVLRRLRNDIPDFAFDAWIEPLDLKVAGDGDRLLLGCPTSFHRERILRHHLDAIEQAVREAVTETAEAREPKVAVLSAAEFAEAEGVRLELRTVMRTVGVVEQARAANGPGASGARSDPSIRARSAGPVAAPSDVRSSTPPTTARPSLDPDGARRLHALPGRVPRKHRPAPGAHPGRTGTGAPLPTTPESPNARARVAKRGAASPRHGEPRSDRGPDFELDGRPHERGTPPFSFDRFVVGPCNALAREAALAMARRRQQSLNLLYLSGASGMGKTHLARATTEEARRQLPAHRFERATGRSTDRLRATPHGPAGSEAETETATRGRIVYTTAERFTADFVSAIRKGQNDAWTRRYRGPIELLVVEDVQFLSGRAKTQQELFHTLGHVLESGGRVLLTGDRVPRELTGLDERLRAVVARGFLAELDRPDALVRRHLLRAKAASAGVHLPSDCLDLLVDATEDAAIAPSVIDLESLLVQVIMTASLEHRSIDLGLCRAAIALKSGASVVPTERRIEISEIVRTVAVFFGARPEALASRSRRRDVLVPRQLAMYLAHRYTEASLTEIGRALGRDHPAVKNAIQKIEDQALKNAPLRYQVEALSERIDALRDARD